MIKLNEKATIQTNYHFDTVLNILDTVFGILVFLYLFISCKFIFTSTPYEIKGLMILFCFVMTNFGLTQISKRYKHKLQIETFRYILDYFVFCPLILYYLQINNQPFWYPYLILTLGSASTTFHLTSNYSWAVTSICSGLLSYFLSTYFLIDNPDWFQVLVNSATMIMFSVLFMKVIRLVNLSYESELEKSKELKKALEDLNVTQELVIQQSKMSALGEMAGGIAHEINNPLGIISGSVKTIEKAKNKGVLTDERLFEALRKINFTVDRISRIINGMRVVSRNSNEVKKENVLLNNIIEDVLGLCTEKFKSHGIDIQIEDHSNVLKKELFIDRVQISQVILNLLSNAFDAIEHLEEKWIKVVVEDSQNSLAIRIIDSGDGISAELREKIFNPFYTSKELGKGTGLGLSISKKIVSSNNGSLDLDIDCPKTCFILTLPKVA